MHRRKVKGLDNAGREVGTEVTIEASTDVSPVLTGSVEFHGLGLTWALVTDVGKTRALNEDSATCHPPLFAVADGMGGHDAGDVASQLAIAAMENLARAHETEQLQASLVIDEIQRVNYELFTEGSADGSNRPMGTTLVGLFVVQNGENPAWLAVNVGDSRIYGVEGGKFAQVTRDHSLVQELVDAGEITEEQSRSHPQRNVVTRALGVDPMVVPDVTLIEPTAGSRYLLCSDGLSGEVDDANIERIILGATTCGVAATELVVAALNAGGRDNVTVLVLDVTSVDFEVEVESDDLESEEITAPREIIRIEDDAAEFISGVPVGLSQDDDVAPSEEQPTRENPVISGLIDAAPPGESGESMTYPTFESVPAEHKIAGEDEPQDDLEGDGSNVNESSDQTLDTTLEFDEGTEAAAVEDTLNTNIGIDTVNNQTTLYGDTHLDDLSERESEAGDSRAGRIAPEESNDERREP